MSGSGLGPGQSTYGGDYPAIAAGSGASSDCRPMEGSSCLEPV